MNIAVIVPTYNEAENIGKLIPSIHDALKEDYTLIVVDDNSKDDTQSIVLNLSQSYPVELIARPGKLGYASAVKDGLRFGLEHSANLLIHMDADFSHDPARLPQIIAASDNHDIVIGSRYIKGGGVQNWNLTRRFISSSANFIARSFLGIKANDCTGGFRCYRRSVFDKADLFSINVEGYSFLLASIFRLQQAGLTITEIPVTFVDRRFGKSKLSRKIILEAMFLVVKLSFCRISLCMRKHCFHRNTRVKIAPTANEPR
jgi:dolichol-phosphate mannosyltransferase